MKGSIKAMFIEKKVNPYDVTISSEFYEMFDERPTEGEKVDLKFDVTRTPSGVMSLTMVQRLPNQAPMVVTLMKEELKEILSAVI